MTALAMIMREAAGLGKVEMAASHVINQYMMLIALGLDGFAHASEALAGAAWGRSDRAQFRRWVYLTGYWSLLASLFYALLFWLAKTTRYLFSLRFRRQRVITIVQVRHLI